MIGTLIGLVIITLIELTFDYFAVTPREEMIVYGIILGTAMLLVAVFTF